MRFIQAAILVIGFLSLDALGYQSMTHSIGIAINSNGGGSLEFASYIPRSIQGGTINCEAQFLPSFPKAWNVKTSHIARGSQCEVMACY